MKSSVPDRSDSIQAVFPPARALTRSLWCLVLVALEFLGTVCMAASAPPSNAFPEDFNPFTEEPALDTGPAAHIRFVIQEHDFGTIAPGSKHEYVFRFTNTGIGTLQIKKTVRSTCGCAVPELSKTRYAPGESGALKVTYTATGAPGTFKKNLYVECNDPNQPVVTLTLKAQVVPPVKYSPAHLVLRTKGKEAGCPPITLQSTDDMGFAILDVMATGNTLSFVCDPNRITRNHTFQPHLNIENLKNHPHGYLALRLTHPRALQMRIPYRMLPEYQVQPVNLILFNAEPNKPFKRRVTVSNSYQEAFAIKEISSKQGIIPMQAVVLPAAAPPAPHIHTLALTLIPPPVRDRSVSDTLTVKLRNKQILEIPVRLFYRQVTPTP